jgi:hypothetical protein
MSINSSLCKFLFSDKMNSRNMILSGAILALVMLVTTNVFFTGSVLADKVGTGINPGSMLSVYMVKKAALICDSGTGQIDGQMLPQTGGCVDVENADPGVSGSGPQALTDF